MKARPGGRRPARGDPQGGLPARRAVVRWAWRLFRREWRQQLLVLSLVIVAVAATVIGSAVAADAPAPPGAGFGAAQDVATFSGADPYVTAQVGSLERRFGRVEVIENEMLSVPGSVSTFDLRAQSPTGPYGSPMLALVAGRYPSVPGEVALTRGVASDFDLRVGGVWHEGGVSRRVVGLVENPQDFLDEFALVVPGQVQAPTQVTVLFDAPGVSPTSIGPNVMSRASVSPSSALNPETISLGVLTIGMILIALVAAGGFTVLAQRRRRSLALLASIGATDRHIGLVVRADGVVVGAAGALMGTALGLVAWLAYRPHLEQSAEHTIGVFALPWTVVALAVVLAVAAAYVAASHPARSTTTASVVAALSGHPAPPKRVRRSLAAGTASLAGAFALLGLSGSAGSGSVLRSPELVLGIVALVPAVVLLAPSCLALVGRVGRRAPVAVRLALRDLSRYRARSGSALAAIGVGVMIAVVVVVAAAARYGDVFDYAGPNLAPDQIVVHNGLGPEGARSATPYEIGRALDAQHVVPLDSSNAFLVHTEAPYEGFGGTALYVATPQLLGAFGIRPSEIAPDADVLTMRPGLSSEQGIVLTGCTTVHPPPHRNPGGGIPLNPLCPDPTVLEDPVIQEVGALPSGTSAPNIVVTEHGLRALGIQSTSRTFGWLIETPHPLTTAEIRGAQATASAAGLRVESKNDQPGPAEVIDWATVFGIAVALFVLASSVGLVRSETVGDLRTLAATGASGNARRTVTAATAGALGLLGALLGTAAGYVGVVGWIWHNPQAGGLASLANVPVGNLLVILGGMPAAAVCVGWLVSGRQPPAMARQATG